MSEINGMYTSDAQAIHDSRGRSRPESKSPSTWRHARRDARWLSGRAEELPQDGMHLHHLLPPDRLVQLNHDAHGEQDPGARGVPDGADHVGARGQGAHRGSGNHRDHGDVPVEHPPQDPGIPIPLDSICRATSSGPMFVVIIQNFANMTEPPMKTARKTRICTKTCQY